MKIKLSLFIVFFQLIGYFSFGGPITKMDRKKALDSFKSSQKKLLQAVNGLSEEQLHFKPDETTWSIAECVEHIAISEQNLFGLLQMIVAEPAELDTKPAMSDEQLMQAISSRNQKVKTRKEFEPTNKFGSYKASLKSFKEFRSNNINFTKSTDLALRSHFYEFPFGPADAYQILLFISAHTERHIAQLNELKEMKEYPEY